MLKSYSPSIPPVWPEKLISRAGWPLLWLVLLAFALSGCATPVPVCPAPHKQPNSLIQYQPVPEPLNQAIKAIKTFENLP